MKFRFVWVGKTKDKNLRTLQEEYLQRLSHFIKCEIAEVKDTGAESPEIEGKRILEVLNLKSFVVSLDVDGKAISSAQFAGVVENWQNRGLKEISFVIGGANGLSPEVAETVDYSLSLSFLTFTHEMARVLLLEQLYRAFTIIKGFPYQK
jgi:23S rRNA (pseudouridine1915-N3)-methyltransferase